jgi:cyclopropane fatty-acyl-phospholipid synthase-like methyltransferase
MFNAPMSLQRAEYLIDALDLSSSDHVVDLGCGSGTFLRMLATKHQVTGVGIDKDETLIQQAKDQWATQTSKSDLQFVSDEVIAYIQNMPPADVLICIGAEYIFGGYEGMLEKLDEYLKPKGVLLVGTIYWKQPPSKEYLSIMNGENPNFDLYTTAKLAHERGFVTLEVHRSNDDEWDKFESFTARKRYTEALETDQPSLNSRAWRWQSFYLKDGIDTMGFCYLHLRYQKS